ncbi:major facilitator superfamily domain-containing protein 4A-like [Anneissia japonica]|uniref:major facilitator superfamily domain-containing protein 4A-like n=1 Tax=Anneissia japonica TaxID=1529436 RepID=UPI0014256452|nr:major facilitator superfamily domain-containing protein 4A-like [Anneissia japonica]
MIGVTIALIPLCHELWMLAVVLAIMGIFMGIIDTVANVSLLKIYGKLVSPFLQALHFCYGLGAFVSPIVAEPFLLNEDCTAFIENETKNASDRTVRQAEEILVTEAYGVTEAPNTTIATLEEAQHKTHVRYAFWIMAVIQVQ